MNEQPLNLRASLQEIWRRRLFVIIIAALCGLGGFAYGLLKPTNQIADALVLVPPSSLSSSGSSANTSSGSSGIISSGSSSSTCATGNGMCTQAVIATSTPVLAAAGAKVSPSLGAHEVDKLVTVSPLSEQILQIQTQASPRYAVKLANAIAASYIDYVGKMEANSAKAAVAALQHQDTQLTRQIKNLQSQIDAVTLRIASDAPGSSQSQQDTNLLGSLRSEQNQVALQLNSVTNQITSTQIGNDSASNTTRILQTATAQPTSRFTFPIEAGLIAFALGALGSAVFVLMRLQRRYRLRFRDEIARTAGAPVIASLDAPRCTTVSAWRDLLAGPLRATTEWSLRHVLHSLPKRSSPPWTIRVISFAGDAPALATGPRLALHAAISGMRTVLVPELPSESKDRSLATLWAAFTSGEPVNRDLPLTLGLNEAEQESPELLVSIAVLHGSSTVLASSDAVNLLSISANAVTDEELAQFALQTTDSGLNLEGVVVVNPDQFDNTTGSPQNDPVRLLPSRGDASGNDHELVHLGTLANDAGAAPNRLPRGGM